MPLPKSFTKVTTFSKWLALSMFIIIPILSFYYGRYYQEQLSAPLSVLFSVNVHGGLCLEGKECSQTTVLNTDGTVVRDGKLIKNLSQQQMKELQNKISEIDFAEIKKNKQPSNYTCPLAYDGQETTYTFYTSSSTEILPSCEYKLDGEIFTFIDETVTR